MDQGRRIAPALCVSGSRPRRSPFFATIMCRIAFRLAAPSLIAATLAIGPLHAQSRPAAAMTTLSRARIDSVFRFVTAGAPGCGAGIYRDGTLAWSKGYGLASLEHQIPINARTVFDLGSTSKQFTAALTLLLVADGKLTLETPVRRVVTELPAWGDSVTVRQLLHHTAGVRDYLSLFELAGVRTSDFASQTQAIALVARQQALDFTPGSAYSYSNSGYLLLAEIVTRLSGMPLAEVAQRRIFGPLGMTNTRFLDRYNAVVPARAWGYEPTENGFTVEMSDFEQVGDGAVLTTLTDLAKWVRNYEQPTVGGAALVRELEATGTVNAAPHMYARGLMVDSTRGIRRVRHGGSWAGFRAELVRLPERRLGVAVLCNRSDANPVRFADRIIDALLDEARVARTASGASLPATTLPVEQSTAYAGSYFGGNMVVQIVARRDTLFIQTGDEQYRLLQYAPGQFEMVGPPSRPTVRFIGSPATAISAVQVRAGGGDFEYRRFDPTAQPTAADKQRFVGTWYSEELDAEWQITADSSGALHVALPRHQPEQARPISSTILSTPMGTITLQTGRGSFDEFTVDTGRARGIRFRRVAR